MLEKTERMKGHLVDITLSQYRLVIGWYGDLIGRYGDLIGRMITHYSEL